MTAAKRKISVSLDADLVRELEATRVPLSTQVNDAIRDELERRRRQRLLAKLLADLDHRHGPVPRKLIEKYEAILS
jgi:antitoxin CcdA